MTDAKAMTAQEYRAARKGIQAGTYDLGAPPPKPGPGLPDARAVPPEEYKRLRREIARGAFTHSNKEQPR